MRNAPRPNRPSVGTRSKKAMSSSIVMETSSGHQFVAARLGDQDRGRRRVLLHLLAQSVDVRFERMRGHARIVAPHFLQQRLARHRALAGTIEITQDGGLLLGE